MVQVQPGPSVVAPAPEALAAEGSPTSDRARRVVPVPAPAGPGPSGPPTAPGAGRGSGEDDLADEELLVTVGALREAADHLLGARGAVTGVTGAAGAVQAALSAVAAAVPLAVLSTDRHGVVNEANAAAGHLLATSFPRLRGKPLQVFVPPDQRRAVRSAVARAWRTGSSRCRVPMVPRSGEAVEVDAVVVATGDTASGHDGLQWVLAPRGAGADPADPGTTGAGAGEGRPATADRAGTGAAPGPGPDAPGGAATDDPATASTDAGSAGPVDALAELCTLRPGPGGLQALMSRVAALLARATPAADHVSITLGDPVAPAVTAADSATAQRLDGLQVACGDGPAADAWSSGAGVTSAHLAVEQRWPRLTAAARATGLGCLAAVPVCSGTEVVGVLTLYGARPGALVSEAALDRVAVFAAAVAALVEQDRHVAELRTTADQLRSAMASRATIEQAKGMVAAWLGCSVDEAFTALSRWSQDRNVKLREVAAFVVADPDRARPTVLSRAAA